MFGQFLEFVLACFRMIVQTLQNTDLGGFSYEAVLVSVLVVTMIVRVVFIIMK